MTEEEKNKASDAEAREEAAPVTEEAKPKPARKPRAAKAAAVADAAAPAPGAEEKPKPARRTRAAAKPKAEAAKPEAVKPEAVKADAPKAAKPAKAEPKKAEPKKAEPRKAEPKKPALRSRGARREHQEPVAAPVVRAQAKYVRSSARKARLVCDNIRGKSVDDARAILAHTPRAVARDWSKLLESAVANAEHNHELVGEDLVIKAVTADEGPTIKRFRPRAMGRATKIRKRTSHLTILLTPKN
jgi:ribosomal protein L22